MEPILATLIVFGSIGLVLWRWIESRHSERMAMIEKGVSPAEFKGVPLREWFRTNPLSSLKWGLLAVFVGLGIMFAMYLHQSFDVPDGIYISSMLVAGGLALIIFYFVASKKLKKEQA
jgi:hypothetical protein